MKTVKLLKNISLVCASLFSLIISIIYFANSYSFWQDEYGTDISFNETYSIAIVVSLLVLGYAIYKIVCFVRKAEENELVGTSVAISSTALVSFYSLGKYFKALNKAIAKGKEFDFDGNKAFLYIGILVLLLCAYYSFKLFESFKAKKK